ncbi:MAG: hypothetical protein FWF97_01285 [Alphaproteobacteria bacterium]|nr:hypothetical protein [Alphaproteobacteria bacterium]
MKKAIIVGLMLPLVSEVCMTPAQAVSMVAPGRAAPTTSARPAMARMPSLSVNTGAIVIGGVVTNPNAGLIATCDSGGLPERLTSQRCITRYDSCLRQENVCGEHFELCYSLRQFNKSRIMCQDYLAQCPADAIKAIFGNSVTTSDDFASANRTMCDGESILTNRTFSPALQDIAVAADSRIDLSIKEGNSWAASNSVKTCNKAADACIENACKNAPHKCISMNGFSDIDVNEMVSIATSGETTLRLNARMLSTWINNMGWDDSNVKNYIKEQCRDMVGGNQWCFLVTNGKPAKEADLVDIFNIQEVYQDIMFNGVGARWKMQQSNIKEWAAKAAMGSLEECKTAMVDCAINSCGEGSRARCYGLSKMPNGSIDIKQKSGIAGACESVINNNQYCADIFVDKERGAAGDAWAAMWTRDESNAIAMLNTDLSKAFNEQAVANLRKSCQNQAEQCIRSECGNDFTSCFISSANTDNISNKTVGGDGNLSGTAHSGGFDGDMAKGLCLLQVKKFEDCGEYFDVQYAKMSSGASADTWGMANSNRNAWMAQSTAKTGTTVFEAGCFPSNTYANIEDPTPMQKACATQEQNIFEGLVADIARYAQDQLHKSANMIKNECEKRNPAGIKNFIWGKMTDLTNRNQPTYTTSVSATADVFGGFCQGTMTINFIDTFTEYEGKRINISMANLTKCDTKFFAPVGTELLCGEDITKECFDEIDKRIEDASKVCTKRGETGCLDVLNWGQRNPGVAGLLSGIGIGAAGGVGGWFAGDAIGKKVASNAVGKDTDVRNIDNCIAQANSALNSLNACATNYSTGNTVAKSSTPACSIDANSAKGIPQIDVYSYTCAADYSRVGITEVLAQTSSALTIGLNECIEKAKQVQNTLNLCKSQVGGKPRRVNTEASVCTAGGVAVPNWSCEISDSKNDEEGTIGKAESQLNIVVSSLTSALAQENLRLGQITPVAGTAEYKARNSALQEVMEVQNVIAQLNAAKTRATQNAQTANEKKRTAWAITGASVLGTIGAVGGGVGVSEALKERAATLRRGAGDAAANAWFDSKNQVIKCYSGGQTYGFGDPMVVK